MSAGPGTGISLTLPIAHKFSIMCNAGGLYLWGNEKYSSSLAKSVNTGINNYGFNTGASLVYFIESASTAISVGGRYQYLKIKFDDGVTKTSKFYGITLSTYYLFSI